jgi:hypothetical protein
VIYGMDTAAIAPCGMNCLLCLAYRRSKDKCPGCRGPDNSKAKYCVSCRIKNCPALAGSGEDFCYACPKYPCARLKQLDRRYRTKYGMSMLENLNLIREKGSAAFLTAEAEKWRCGCGALLCVHRAACLNCGAANGRYPARKAAEKAAPRG